VSEDAARRDRPAAERLWAVIEDHCNALEGKQRPVRSISVKTGLSRSSVSDWFRQRYVPEWERFEPLMAYFPADRRAGLQKLWHAAWAERQIPQELPAAPLLSPPTPSPSPVPQPLLPPRGGLHRLRPLRYRLTAVAAAVVAVSCLAWWLVQHDPTASAQRSPSGPDGQASTSTVVAASGQASAGPDTAAAPASSGQARTQTPPQGTAAAPIPSRWQPPPAGDCVFHPKATAGSLRQQCQLVLSEGETADLDDGPGWTVDPYRLGGPYDVRFDSQALSPQPGTDAKLAFGPGKADYDDCFTATVPGTFIEVGQLRPGMSICVTTDDDRTAALRVESVRQTGSRVESIVFLAIVWGRPNT